MNENTLSELQKQIRLINREKGWYDKPVSFGELIALIHSEASEALEAYRRTDYESEGEADSAILSELADIVIRTLDTAERCGFNLEAAVLAKLAKNKERPYRHGNKRL